MVGYADHFGRFWAWNKRCSRPFWGIPGMDPGAKPLLRSPKAPWGPWAWSEATFLRGPKAPLGPERSDFFKGPKGPLGPLGLERSDFFKGPKGPL